MTDNVPAEMPIEGEIIGPNEPGGPRVPETPKVTVNLYDLMQQAMKDEAASMKQYNGVDEYTFFKNWGQKWRDQDWRKANGF